MRSALQRAAVMISLALACAFSVVAHAQEPTEKERLQIAREAFDAGQRAFDGGNLDGAIATWKQGYESKDDPLFLLKIATAYEKKSDTQKAIFYYKAYLHDAPRAKRAPVERHVAELEAHPAPPPEPAPPPAPVPEAAPAPTPVPDEESPAASAPSPAPASPTTDQPGASPGHGLKVGGVIIGAGGVVLAGVGVVFALSAHSIQNDLEASTRAGKPWSAALSTKESSGRRDALLGKLGLGFGAAAIATGTTLFVLGGRKDARAAAAADDAESRLEILPALGPDGAGVAAGVVVRGPW